jgi:hypothetical protein
MGFAKSIFTDLDPMAGLPNGLNWLLNSELSEID